MQFVLENLWAVYDAVLANRFVNNTTSLKGSALLYIAHTNICLVVSVLDMK